MKRFLSIFLSVIIIFSFILSASALTIQFEAATRPEITDFSLVSSDNGADINVTFTHFTHEAEEMRQFLYSLILEKHGTDEKISNSNEKYILSDTKLYCEISTDNHFYSIIGELSENSFSLSLYDDILPFLYKAGESIPSLSENGRLYLRVTMASESITDKDTDTVYVYAPSEHIEITLPSFCYILHDVPSDVTIPVKIPLFFSEPLSEKIVLPNLLRKGYEFGGWYENSTAIGVIPAGTEKMILKTKWNPLTYEINYVTSINLNTSFGKVNLTDMPVKYTVGEEVKIKSIDAPLGYVFKGWYADESFSGERITCIPAGTTGDITLFAKWITTDEAAEIKKQEQLEYIKEQKYGDLDSDGKITANDARMVLRATVKLDNYDYEIMRRADYYGTGKILASNARTTLRISVGLDNLYDILLKNGVLPQ